MNIIDYSIRAGEPLDKFDHVTHQQIATGKFLDLVAATTALNFRHTTYTRKLLLEGQLEGIKVKIGHLQKWFISRQSCQHYRQHISRKEKPRRYILRIVTNDEQTVREALDNLDIDYSLEFAYNGGK